LPCAGQIRSRAAQLHPARIPYTAEYHITRVQTLANGSTITREDTETKARDAQGRQMFSSTVSLSQQKTVTNVTITDPVAHTFTHWNSLSNRATVQAMSGPHARGCESVSTQPGAASTRTQERPVVEDLGTDSIQGIEAHGTRSTTTIPVGEIGNDVPLVSTFERWVAVSPELGGLMVREASDDPRNGKSNRELTSFTKGDPDPSLFQPPSGYEIVTEEVVKGASAGCPSQEATKQDAAKQNATQEEAP